MGYITFLPKSYMRIFSPRTLPMERNLFSAKNQTF